MDTHTNTHDCMLITSTSWCQCSIGLRGLASMAVQCSLPGPSASLPTRHIPITSLWPMLTRSNGGREGKRGWEGHRAREGSRKERKGLKGGIRKAEGEGDRARKKQAERLIYQPWALGKEYSGWGRKLNSSSQIHTGLYEISSVRKQAWAQTYKSTHL